MENRIPVSIINMNNCKLKSILSFFIMSLFIFFGFASIDEGDPETQIYNCDYFNPHFSKVQAYEIFLYEHSGDTVKPLTGQIITFFIKDYAKTGKNDPCSLELKNAYTITLNFGNSFAKTLLVNKSYTSKDDLLVIDFTIDRPGYNKSQYTLHFTHDYDAHSDFYILLKQEEYP
ncbi:MAG: hypothetical protein IPM34_14235 [Saprospiraceae bacterium]|nr:hypothetical protein [Saprospiraceae bacterium]